MNLSSIKQISRSQVSQNFLVLMLCTMLAAVGPSILASIFSSVAVVIPYLGLLLGPILSAVICGVAQGPLFFIESSAYLIAARGGKPSTDNLFDDIGNHALHSAILGLLISIYTFLWSLLFFIPGIIKSISYSMAYYIMIDNPSITATEAINRSRKMMYGHKMQYFVLQLSFIGWILLSSLTCGILLLWVMPYMRAASTNFYMAIKGEDEGFDAYTDSYYMP